MKKELKRLFYRFFRKHECKWTPYHHYYRRLGYRRFDLTHVWKCTVCGKEIGWK